jgi:cytoskeletal protein CcmA (bactofilin family)
MQMGKYSQLFTYYLGQLHTTHLSVVYVAEDEVMTQSKAVLIGATFLVALLGACGGGSSGDSAVNNNSNSSGDIITVGRIDGFGSVYVNGIKFDTSDTEYQVDDEQEYDDSSLAVGMKVRIEGTVNEDGVTGFADIITYDDDLEGPIDSGSLVANGEIATFTILNMAVMVDANSTVFDDGASYDGLAEGQEIEVSGFFDGTQIVAARIELQNDSDEDYEIKGTVTSYDDSEITLVLQNGVVAGPFPLSLSVELDIPSDPVGLFVELKLESSGGSPEVVRIESDDSDLIEDDDEDVSLHGILADDGSGGYSVNGVIFEISSDTRYEPDTLEGSLSAGMEVEVEGYMQGDILIAEKIEAEDSEIEIEAPVSSVESSDAKNGTITLDLGNGQSLAVMTDNSTLFDDSSDYDLDEDGSFNLDELRDGDYVEVELKHMGDQYVAISIERKDESSSTKIEAPVEAVESHVSVTLVGAVFSVYEDTEYKLDDDRTDADTFFNQLNIGERAKIEDQDGDASIEEIELER